MLRRPLLALCATLLLALSFSSAHAAAVRWTNAAGGNWSVTTNWSTGAVPAATDTAVFDLAGTYTVTVNPTTLTIAGLRISGAASGVQTVTAASGRTLTFNGPVIVGAQGVLTLGGATVNGTGTCTVEGTLNLANQALPNLLNLSGTLVATGACAANGPYLMNAGSTLRIAGVSALNGQFTVANAFTNNGTIELTSSGAATAATLAVTNGTLTNAAGGSIQSLVGSGGARNLTAKLDNQGTITVAQALTTNKASVAHTNSGTIDLTAGNYTILISGTGHSFTTTGTINVAAGRTLTLQGGVTGGLNQNFNFNSGTMGGAGTIALLNAQLNLNQPLASDATLLDGTTSTLAGLQSYTVKAGTTVNMNNCDLNGLVNVDNGGTFTLLNCGGSGTINTNGLVEYTGANTLTGIGPLVTSGGSVLRMKGVVGLNATLTCTNGFTNNGSIELTSSGAATAATLAVTNGTLTNAVGASISSLAGSGGARGLNAKLDNQGTITVAQALTTNKASVAHVNSGTINLTTGDYTILISTTTPSFTTTGTINVPAGRTLTFQGGVTGGLGQNFNYNGGTMGGAGTVALLNAQLNLNTALASDMAILSGTTSTLAGPQTYTVRTGTTVSMNNCDINGTVVVENGGTFALVNSGGSGTINTSGLVEYTGANTLTGASPLVTSGSSVLRIKGIVGVNGALTCTNGFTNNGSIELTSSGAATAATLAVTNGTLTNVAGATIASLAGSGGARGLNAKLDNQGTITVAQSMTTNKASVAHVNSGTINLTTGDYTILISITAPSFTTTGTINVPAGRTLTFQGGVTGGLGQNFNYNGGTMGGAGTVALLNAQLNLNTALASDMAILSGTTSTLAGPQTYTVKSGTTVSMNNCDINGVVNVDNGGTFALVNSGGSGTINTNGLVEYTGANTLTGATPLITSGGSVLRLKGIVGLNAALTCTNGFTNNGSIELTSSGAATAATLAVTNGTLTNVAGATIASLAGSGGGRNLNAKLDNQGTITVAQSMTTNKASVAHVNSGTINLTTGDYTVLISITAPSFTTTGTINVPAGRTLTFQGGVTGGLGQNFNYNGGTMGGAGTVALLNAQLNLNTALASDMARLDGTTSTLAGPQTYTVKTGTTVNMNNCDINGVVNVDNGGTFALVNSGGSGTLNTNGLVEYTGANTLTGATPLITSGGSVLRLKGIVGLNAALTCTNGFTNNGSIELTSSGAATAATLTVTNGTLTNAAGAAIQSLAGSGGGRNLNAKYDNQGTITVAQAMTTNKASSALVNSGTINLTTGNYTIVITATAPSFTTTGTINVPAGRTLTLQGGVAGGLTQNFNYNAGTMGGAGTVALLNSQLNVNQPLHTTATHLTGTNSTLAGSDTLFADGGTTTLTGCTVTGPVVATAGSILNENCDWNNGFFLHGGATVEWRGSNTSNGYYMGAGSISRVIGTTGVNASLTFGGSQGNAGLLELTSSGAVAGATVTTSSAPGQGFFNGATGEIRASVGGGGVRQLLAYLDNQGLADFQASTTLNRAAVAHRNRGTVQVASGKILTVTGASFTNDTTGVLTGGGTITMNGATTFAQRGTIRPGGPQGTLTLNGACPNTATAVHDIEIGGDGAVTGYDRFAVRDAATIAGTLNISLANGYLPKPGVRYVIVDALSRTGTFSTVNGLSYGPGQLWTIAYSDTDVALVAQDQTWTRVFPDGAPPAARDGHTAVYDSTGDRMIVFGGRTNGGVQNDVWVLTKATGANYPAWVALSPAGTPPAPRTNASAVYDGATNRMIVFGGEDGALTPAPFADAWVLTNANGLGGTPTWTALTPGAGPAARSAHGAAYDAANNRMMIFGGTTTPGACGGALADVWTLENANGTGGAPVWTLLAPTGVAPGARAFAGVSYDRAANRLIVTGGDDVCGAANTESYVLDGANGLAGTPVWTALAPSQGAAAGWSRARYAWDPVLDRVDAFGGQVGGAYVDTTYTLTGASSGASPGWYRRNFYGTRPTPRASHSLVLTNRDHVAVVFGGLSSSGRLNDVWRRATDLGPVLDVDGDQGVTLPQRTAFALPPSPNPARGEVTFAIDIARDQPVDLGIFDITGRRVATMHTGNLAAGRHTFHWNASAAPGVYLVRMNAQDRKETARIVRVK